MFHQSSKCQLLFLFFLAHKTLATQSTTTNKNRLPVIQAILKLGTDQQTITDRLDRWNVEALFENGRHLPQGLLHRDRHVPVRLAPYLEAGVLFLNVGYIELVRCNRHSCQSCCITCENGDVSRANCNESLGQSVPTKNSGQPAKNFLTVRFLWSTPLLLLCVANRKH